MPNCSPPPYAYRPEFVAGDPPSCAMDKHQELRSRSPVGLGGTFFRSKNTGTAQNDLSLEMVYDGIDDDYTLTVRDDGTIVETFGPHGGQGAPVDGICPGNLIGTFRSDVNTNSTYIEMPTIDYGGESASSSPLPIFESATDDAGCLSAFSETSLFGGNGAPASPTVSGDPAETQPRTGPERTLYVVTSTEIVTNTPADDGQSYNPIPAEKIKQWDGTAWIDYEVNVCP